MAENNRWASLYRASQDISADLDIEGVYVAIHNAAEKVMPCDDFIIDGYDEETNEVVPLYIYDLWGDTVNTASRMESQGLPDAAQVTQAVRDRLNDRYIFKLRGEIPVKGKGNMMTYLLTGRK